MTRNQNSNFNRRTASANSRINSNHFTDDSLVQLPDLSGLSEEEKQHILDVLLRDESLRSQHLSRFLQLRKEVNDLEQRPQPTSNSVCARCQTPFGFLFNTGDTCPKCGAKVCKQCRLMYNVNDNGWLCQLCCKQMQLMSYSGEWIYTIRSNLRKDSVTASEVIRKSLSPTLSIRNLNAISSSDTETEDNTSTSGPSSRPKTITKDKSTRMLVQTPIDEKKLNSVKQTVHKRPPYQYQAPLTIPVPQPSLRPRTASANLPTGGSSDDVDSLYDQSTNYTGRTSRSTSSGVIVTTNPPPLHRPSIGKSIDSLSTMQNNSNDELIESASHLDVRPVDCASVTSSEWGADDNKSERDAPITVQQRTKPSSKYGSKQSLSSRLHLAGSIQNLRDAVHRIPKGHLSTSRTSLNSEKKSNKTDHEQKSNSTPDKQNISNSRTTLTTLQTSNEEPQSAASRPRDDPIRSSLGSEPVPRTTSTSTDVETTANVATADVNQASRPETFGSVGHLDMVDSDDDIDGTFEKAKLGSQLSINSALSETKARYGLDISGTVELKLTYAINTGALDILINQCQNLASAKRNQASDPYVKIYLLPDRSKNSKRKTSVKKHTVNPVYAEKFRYHVTKQEFETRILWISVWSQGTLGHNDFLGEVHIPLANCVLDRLEEYQLLAQTKKNDLTPHIEPTMEPGEIQFQITFIQNPKNRDIGTLQIHHVEGKAIFYGKSNVDAVCKGVLMPEILKRKLPTVRKGPSPKWEIPLRWDGVRRDNLRNHSVEISIWGQERFRKVKIGFVRLNLCQGHFDNKPVDWLDATKAEKSAWEIFLQRPTQVHQFRLPLRAAKNENK